MAATKRYFIVLIVAVCALFAMSASSYAVQKLSVIDEPLTLPEFELEDENGSSFDLESMKGSWNLVTLGFTSCPDICPFVLSNLNAVSKKLTDLGIAVLPRVVFVGVDPIRDRDAMGEYVKYFGKNIIGVTGSHSELEKIAKGIQANYVIRPKPGTRPEDEIYDVQHSAFVALVSPSGEMIAQLNPPLPAEDTARFILDIISSSLAGAH